MMLNAGNWAPTHGKTEPWRWVVVRGDSKEMEEYIDINAIEMRKMKGKKGPEADEKIEMKLAKKPKELRKCAYLIFIIQKKVANDNGGYMPDWEETAAVACSVQNMHLMATSLGIAAYWSSGGWDTVLCSSAVKTFLNIAEEDKCLGIFHVGRSDKMGSYRASRGDFQKKTLWKGVDMTTAAADHDDDDGDD
jgi:nitroreductase